MYFDGPDLIYTGDNGVFRLRDADGEAESDEDNAFELAFAEEADWRQF